MMGPVVGRGLKWKSNGELHLKRGFKMEIYYFVWKFKIYWIEVDIDGLWNPVME